MTITNRHSHSYYNDSNHYTEETYHGTLNVIMIDRGTIKASMIMITIRTIANKSQIITINLDYD